MIEKYPHGIHFVKHKERGLLAHILQSGSNSPRLQWRGVSPNFVETPATPGRDDVLLASIASLSTLPSSYLPHSVSWMCQWCQHLFSPEIKGLILMTLLLDPDISPRKLSLLHPHSQNRARRYQHTLSLVVVIEQCEIVMILILFSVRERWKRPRERLSATS